ncbi:DegT/DnrJ/EryC1/StrS family aminotransferase [Bremerella alba]|uniref:UDP-4-amino-4-deoxy-L-arabinose--oxoglutarate aminotransferase n=1 Tax=Bremerella alba TaxID=980252 RepID=A0A7V8V7N8_9BACT|nr:DegT/DnrJ/EryC1/StrS family aminotransferase [Bremerella alba]MBA2116464.1 UDP-4-amino-4-deoxy-L-arabinose--oxoglutarate aminotransferase [Bremerella alba]
MRPRKLFDIDWYDLAFGLTLCLWPRGDRAVYAQWEEQNTLPCLSVRSGFDLLLQALNLPEGSEIATTAVSIPDMQQIAAQHKLVPIGIDLDLATLQPRLEQLESCITPRTRMILAAPLFGTQIDLRPLDEIARRHQLLLVEDCAQAFSRPGYLGSDLADVNLLSFGPIKTATALGGGLIRVRDAQLLKRMIRAQNQYSLQPRRAYALRILKYGAMKILTQRHLFDLFIRLNRLMGLDADQAVKPLTRNFQGHDLLGKIRKLPSQPLVAMIARRWSGYRDQRIERRTELGRLLASEIGNDTEVAGISAVESTWWVFAIAAKDPIAVVRSLRQSGFDATSCHNLCVLKTPSIPPGEMQWLLQNCVFLPIYPELSEAEVRRLGQAVKVALGKSRS